MNCRRHSGQLALKSMLGRQAEYELSLFTGVFTSRARETLEGSQETPPADDETRKRLVCGGDGKPFRRRLRRRGSE